MYVISFVAYKMKDEKEIKDRSYRSDLFKDNSFT